MLLRLFDVTDSPGNLKTIFSAHISNGQSLSVDRYKLLLVKAPDLCKVRYLAASNPLYPNYGLLEAAGTTAGAASSNQALIANYGAAGTSNKLSQPPLKRTRSANATAQNHAENFAWQTVNPVTFQVEPTRVMFFASNVDQVIEEQTA
ncbi:unnamed protein product, partial [Amoebophrya sp. A120]